MRFFPEIWHLNMWGHLKFKYEVPTGPQLTRSLWNGPRRAKPKPALPNRHLRSTFFWDITQHRVVIPYRHFRTTCQSHLQRSTNQKGRTQHDLCLYLLTPCSRVLPEKLTGSAACQEIPRIFGTWRFITILTSAPTCPYPEPTPSSPHKPLQLPEDPS